MISRSSLNLVVVSCLLGSAALASPDPGVEVKDDRFTGARLVHVEPVRAGPASSCERPGVSFIWFAEKVGDSYQAREVGMLVLTAVCPQWTFDRCHVVRGLVDGEPLGELASGYEPELLAGRLRVEKIPTVLPLSAAEKMAAGESIELRLCGREMKLTDSEREDFRAFWAEVSKYRPAATAPQKPEAPPP